MNEKHQEAQADVIDLEKGAEKIQQAISNAASCETSEDLVANLWEIYEEAEAIRKAVKEMLVDIGDAR